jgi:hypothetical protein
MLGLREALRAFAKRDIFSGHAPAFACNADDAFASCGVAP